METQKPVVMYDSPEAAQIKTVSAWVARTGEVWPNNEHMARYCGCTHMRCDTCGAVREKGSWCRPCHDAKQQAKFASHERKAWDGVEPVYLFDTDLYFFSLDALVDYCDEHDVKAADLQLVFCKPNYCREIDAYDHCSEELFEDCDLPDDILAAFDVLNKCIQAHKEPLSWSPDDIAVDPASISALIKEG